MMNEKRDEILREFQSRLDAMPDKVEGKSRFNIDNYGMYWLWLYLDLETKPQIMAIEPAKIFEMLFKSLEHTYAQRKVQILRELIGTYAYDYSPDELKRILLEQTA